MLETLTSALVTSLATAIGQKALDSTAEGVVSALRDKLGGVAAQLTQGDYAPVVQQALEQARDDLLTQYRDDAQHELVGAVLNSLLAAQRGPLLDAFSDQVAQICVAAQPELDTTALVWTYRKLESPAALVQQRAPSAELLTKLLANFFIAFHERLLQTTAFRGLREYLHFVEARQQTALLETIAANTTQPVEDSAQVAAEYRDYLIGELKDHTIRGFAPQVGGRVLSLPLSRIFLPLEAVQGRPALAEYAEQDLMRQAASEVSGELNWRQRREEIEKRYAQLSARQAVQRPLKLADLLASPRAVLLGDPGSGKTTVTRYVAYALAADDLAHTGTQGARPDSSAAAHRQLCPRLRAG